MASLFRSGLSPSPDLVRSRRNPSANLGVAAFGGRPRDRRLLPARAGRSHFDSATDGLPPEPTMQVMREGARR